MRRFLFALVVVVLAHPAVASAQSALAAIESEQQGIFDSLSKSVVFIASKRGYGSGFFVSENLVLTNHHVVGKDKRVNVIVRGGVRTEGAVVARDEKSDLALVEVEARGVGVHLAPLSAIRVGSWVAAVGHGEGGIWSFTTGMVSNVYVKPGNVSVIQTQIPINQGNSGGPVVTRGGEVVGVVTAKSARGENLNFAIPVEVALEKFAQLRETCSSCLRITADDGAQIFVDGRLAGTGPYVVVAVTQGPHEILAMKGKKSEKRTVNTANTNKVVFK